MKWQVAFWNPSKIHPKSSKIVKIVIMTFSKSPFRNIWLIESFFYKDFFVVEISTTDIFFQKKNPSPQNFPKTDFGEFSIVLVISKIHSPSGNCLVFMIFRKSRKSRFWIFWGVEFFFWKNLFVLLIFTTKFFSRKKIFSQEYFQKSISGKSRFSIFPSSEILIPGRFSSFPWFSWFSENY